jgi:hypothetical protein
VAGAGAKGPAEVEKDVEEHQDTEIVCVAGTRVQGVGSFAQRHRVGQPRTQIKRKGGPGGDLHRTAGPGLLRAVGGGQ